MEYNNEVHPKLPRLSMEPYDSSPEAQRLFWEFIRTLKPETRSRFSAEMTTLWREMLREYIRTRHPEYSEEQVKFALIRLQYGDELFLKFFPDKDNLVP